MKKLLIIAIIWASNACGVSKAVDPISNNSCEKSSDAYLKALDDWTTDIQNKSKCEVVKKTLTPLLKDCSVYTAAQRKVYEDQLKDFNCN